MKNIFYYREVFSSKFPTSDIVIDSYINSDNILVKTKYGLCKVRWSHLFNGACPSIKTAVNKTEYCKNQFFEKFPNSELEIIKYENNLNVIIKNNYGLCKVTLNNLLTQFCMSISSALNKTEYFINQAKEVHGDKYDYSLVKWISSNSKINVLCKEHGIFEQRANSHLCGTGCPLCSIQDRTAKLRYNTIEFVEKSNKIHNNKYDYSNTEHINSYSKLKIICKEHGVFEQTSQEHLRGAGCKKCGNLSSSAYQRNFPTGWSLLKWEKKAERSKNFDSFKVYIIECWNETERFYKIGRTFNTVKYRYNSKKLLPYNWKVIKEYTGNAEYVYKLENILKKLNSKNKYIPKNKFAGMQECFKEINKY